MSVIRDVVNMNTRTDPNTMYEYEIRRDASLRIKRMRDVYMSQEEASYWTPHFIHEVLWSLPNEDIETLNCVPNEDVRLFADAMFMDLAYFKNVIDALMG